jgi:hypothetical protein
MRQAQEWLRLQGVRAARNREQESAAFNKTFMYIALAMAQPRPAIA